MSFYLLHDSRPVVSSRGASTEYELLGELFRRAEFTLLRGLRCRSLNLQVVFAESVVVAACEFLELSASSTCQSVSLVG